MGKRFIAWTVVVTTAAFMVFGLFSVSFAMVSGMERCPIMRIKTDCPPLAGSQVPSVNHHVGHFNGLSVSVLSAGLAAFLIVLLVVRIAISDIVGMPSIVRKREWPFASGPPSPVASLIAWVAMHNKVGFLAPVRVHAPRT